MRALSILWMIKPLMTFENEICRIGRRRWIINDVLVMLEACLSKR